MAITFDTLKFVKTLESAGMPAQQAEAVSVAMREAQEVAEVATKGDLRELKADTESKFDLLRKDIDLVRSELRKDIDLVRSDLRGEIALVRRDLIIWLGGALIAGFGVVIGLILKLMG